MKLLNKIQRELKVPKGQFNAFSKFHYRNAEDILEAVKPLLGEGRLILEDEIVQVGDRYYVKATATLFDGEDQANATGWAREASEKKGMDEAQITGAASSYARKYALNGLFCIDDTKDADTDQTPSGANSKRMTPYKVARVTPASDDEAQGHRPAVYPQMDETNDSHPLMDLDKPEPDKNTVVVLELLSELGKPATTPRVAKMNVKLLTGGLKAGITWVPGDNDEDVIEALRKLNVDRMQHGK